MSDVRRLDFERGQNSMYINDRLRPAFEWCEMFGHAPDLSDQQCTRCGGARILTSTTSDCEAVAPKSSSGGGAGGETGDAT